jgi:hypothetical protein
MVYLLTKFNLTQSLKHHIPTATHERPKPLLTKTLRIIYLYIQGVSEIRVLILTSERTRQFMKLFSITFCKIRKSIPRFFAPQFLPNESFCMIN